MPAEYTNRGSTETPHRIICEVSTQRSCRRVASMLIQRSFTEKRAVLQPHGEHWEVVTLRSGFSFHTEKHPSELQAS